MPQLSSDQVSWLTNFISIDPTAPINQYLRAHLASELPSRNDAIDLSSDGGAPTDNDPAAMRSQPADEGPDEN